MFSPSGQNESPLSTHGTGLDESLDRIIGKLAIDCNLCVLSASISGSGKSIDWRIVFGIRSNSKFSGHVINNSKTLETTRNTVKAIGFQDELDIVERIAHSVVQSLSTIRYPIHEIGLSVQGNTVNQLKIYYMMRIYDRVSMTEGIMGKIDRKLAMNTLLRIMEEIDLQDQTKRLSEIARIVDSEKYELEFIGIDFEKGKTPGLKVYFRPVPFK